MPRLRFIAPPIFDDEEKSARAELLFSIVVPCMALTFVWALISMSIVPEAFVRLGSRALALITSCLFVLALARRGHVNVASGVLISLVSAISIEAAWTGGGPRGIPYSGFAVLIMLAGLLLGGRAVALVTLLGFSAGGVLVLAERVGRLPEAAPFELDPLSLWLGSALVFGTVAIFQRLAARMAARGLSRVQAYRDIFDQAAVGLLEVDLSELDSDEDLHRMPEHVIVRHANGEARRLLDLPARGGVPVSLASTVTQIVSTGEVVHASSGITQRSFMLETRSNGTRYVRISLRWPKRREERAKMALSIDDVTAQRELEDHVRQLQRLEAIGRLAGGVAHDFNNLLTVISGHAALLHKRVGSDATNERDIVAIQDTTARGAALTRQLLTWSGQAVHRPEVVAVDPLIVRLQNLLARLIGEDVVLELSLRAHGAFVRMDPSHIEQIVMNLVVNARDSMPRGGRLLIETVTDTHAGEGFHAELGYLRIAVSDTGTGMDEVTQRRVFEPFFTTKPIGQGTGLGLTTVHDIVQRAEGRIAITSKIAKGTRLDVWLPRTSERESSRPRAKPTGLPVTRGATLLIVEDQPAVRNVVQEMLHEHGYVVIAADSPEHAVQLAADSSLRIDAMLTDVVMPTLNGQELSQLIAHERPALPVVFMSGYAADILARHGVEKDAVPYLQKPFTPEQAVEVIESVLSGARARAAS